MKRAIAALVSIAVVLGAGIAWQIAGAEPEPRERPAAPEGAPNVLLIVWDTVRADRMSLYGHDRPTTPWLDALAADALVFEQAISPSFWTLPVHASLFTGLPARAHGASWETRWLDDRFVTAAEWFGANGYDTWAWSTNPNVHPIRNTHQGFDTFHSPFGDERGWREAVLAATDARKHPEDASTPSSPRWPGEQKEVPIVAGPVATEALVDWLAGAERDSARPWFAFVNLMDAHDPRFPSPAARAAIMDPELANASLALDASPGRMRRATWGEADATYTDAEVEVLLAVYDATIRDLDAATRDLLGALVDTGAMEDTVVLLTSDHGEQLGERGLFRHNRTLYQDLVRVPLVLHAPGRVAPGRVPHPVSTAGALATLCELAGLALPDNPGMAIESLIDAPPGPVFTEAMYAVGNRRDGDDREDLWRSFRAIYDGRWKHILASDGAEETYDLQADPNESRPVIDAPEAERLSAELARWDAAVERHTPEVPAGGRSLDAEGLYRDGEDGFVRDALQALGYVE